MTGRIAIVGSGPTGLYTLRHLLEAPLPLDVTILEAGEEAGWGMPYDPDLNGRTLLANIASVEIPPVTETMAEWMEARSDADLARLGIPREAIDERAFYPRVTLGEYFRDQLLALLGRARERGHAVTVLASHEVTDAELRADDILLTLRRGDGSEDRMAFAHVVLATGHTLPDWTETRAGWFASPYPTSALRAIGDVQVGILGSSLSAIDAVVALAGNRGAFLRDASGLLEYHPRPGTDGFRATLMSRKGLLPEADFFFPIPYDDNAVCTPEAVEALAASGRPDLLDAVFDLFREELRLADPGFADRIGLGRLTVDDFADAYFGLRDGRDPFTWAALNLAEAKANYETETVVPWRYAILRTHEVVALVVPHLSAPDLERFHKRWKSVFVDDYATVPHESIERLLALRRAGRLDVLRLGKDYDLSEAPDGPGAVLRVDGAEHRFPAFVDATGQRALSAADLPLPTLVAQGAVRKARAPRTRWSDEDDAVETGGVELDDAFRPVNDLGLCNEIHCLALPFLLHRMPFHQGITSSEELGRTVAGAILAGNASRGGLGAVSDRAA